MPEDTPTVSAIYAHYEKGADGFRPHLGCSQIGSPCDRALWYGFRHALSPAFEGRVLRLFETGNREEDRIVRNLRDVGVTLYDRDPATGKQISVSAFGGHFSGSLDGIGRGFKESGVFHVLEFKTSNTKGFKQMQKVGVEESKPQHYAQMQLYMHLVKGKRPIRRAYYFMVCKETDEIYGERVHYNKGFATQMVNRAERIIDAQNPPERISNDPAWYQCRFCDFNNVCHKTQPALVNCRTCLHATPNKATGKWDCARHECAIEAKDTEAMVCSGVDHLYIPSLVPFQQLDAGDDYVSYKIGGKEICNGLPGKDTYESSEFAAIIQIPAIATDPTVEKLCEAFDAELVPF